MSQVLRLTKESTLQIAKKVSEIVLDGGITIFPTDTVYGLGCDATNYDAVEKIYKIKNRQQNKPLPIIVSDMEMAFKYAKISEQQEMFVKRYIPGPYTFILERKKSIPASPVNKIALRIPELPFTRMIAEYMGQPLVATSANISGFGAVHSFDKLDERIISKADILVNGGETKYHEASTIIDAIKGKILRRGAGLDRLPVKNKK